MNNFKREQKRPVGRPRADPDTKSIKAKFWLKPLQIAKAKARGGSKWIAELIDKS